MHNLLRHIRREPVRFVAAVQTTAAALVLFGVPLTPAQIAGGCLAIAAWLGFVTRQQVTPALAGADLDAEAGQSDLGTICLVIVAVVVLLWAFGVVPR